MCKFSKNKNADVPDAVKRQKKEMQQAKDLSWYMDFVSHYIPGFLQVTLIFFTWIAISVFVHHPYHTARQCQNAVTSYIFVQNFKKS